MPGYTTGKAPPLRIRYLGVWDTVEALGVPGMMWISRFTNRGNAFHDPSITGFVENVRHAVAIDERRSTFPATLCGDLAALNAAEGKAPDAPGRALSGGWFPSPGSVGGVAPSRPLRRRLGWC